MGEKLYGMFGEPGDRTYVAATYGKWRPGGMAKHNKQADGDISDSSKTTGV